MNKKYIRTSELERLGNLIKGCKDRIASADDTHEKTVGKQNEELDIFSTQLDAMDRLNKIETPKEEAAEKAKKEAEDEVKPE